MWRTTTFSGHLTLSSLRTTFRLGDPMEEDVRGNGRNSINAFSDTIQSKSKRQEEKVVALFCLVRLRRTVTPPRKVSRAGPPCDSFSEFINHDAPMLPSVAGSPSFFYHGNVS